MGLSSAKRRAMSIPEPTRQNGFLALLLTQAMALVFCVGIPALVTAIAPVSWVSFQRDAGGVRARVQTCLLFVVPFKTIVVEPVLEVNELTITGSTRIQRRTGTDRKYKADDEGQLLISGPDQLAEVQVSPVDLKAVLGKVNTFLAQPDASELKLFVVANWKFSVLGGGLVTLLTVLYLVGAALALIRMALRAVGVFRR